MNENFVQRYGKFCLLLVFLLSATVSGCNWSDSAASSFEQMTVFENSTAEPVLLYVDSTLVSEVEGQRSYFHSAQSGQHTYSAISKLSQASVGGGAFTAGEYVKIPR